MNRACVHRLVAGLTLVLAGRAWAQSFVNWESPHVHPIDLTPDGARLLAVNTADARLEVFEVSGSGPPRHIGSIPVGLDPVSVRARTGDEAWVVNHVSDTISVVDLPSRRVVRTISTGDEPADVVFAGRPQRAFVTVSQLNQVRVFDPADLTGSAPLATLVIQGEDPRALAVSPDGGIVYAAIFESGNRSTIIARQAVTNPNGPYGGQNPPPNSGSAFDPPLTPGLPLPPPVAQIVKKNAMGAWMDDNNRNWSAQVTWGLHDHDVAIIDAASLAVTYVSGLMNMVAGIAASPGGTVTVVGTDAINEVRFEPNVNGIFVRCLIGSFSGGAPEGSASIADLNPHLDYAAPTVPAALREQSLGDPRVIVWDSQGLVAYVAGLGSNSVIATESTGKRLARIDVGQGPSGLALSADGLRLFVLNRFEATISTIDTATNEEVSRVGFFDPTPSVIRDGRPFLYDTHLTSGLGQASCASCHIDGRTDHLAWDLGNPAGEMIAFNQTCQGPAGCEDWHPMKGPMVTQTLQGIISNEPFHWRGEKNDLSEFNPAYTNLQGRESEITALEMAQLEAFIATIAFPPNPNRTIDNALRTALPVPTGTGNAVNGRNLYLTAPILVGNLTCVTCHALPTGSNNRVDIPGADPQNRKNAQLRNMHEKTGFSRATMQGNRGFGFNHEGDADTLIAVLSEPGFQFPPGPPGQQQRRDIEAFLLSFSSDTHAGVGVQTTARNGGGAGDDAALISQMTGLAAAGTVGLIVKGIEDGVMRGWSFTGAAFQSDRSGEAISPAALLASASAGSERTYTLVPAGSQVRLGIDRDEDGFFDLDELEACSNAADAASTPRDRGCVWDMVPGSGGADIGDGVVDVLDLLTVLAAWGSTGSGFGSADVDCSGVVDIGDLLDVLAAWGACE